MVERRSSHQHPAKLFKDLSTAAQRMRADLHEAKVGSWPRKAYPAL